MDFIKDHPLQIPDYFWSVVQHGPVKQHALLNHVSYTNLFNIFFEIYNQLNWKKRFKTQISQNPYRYFNYKLVPIFSLIFSFQTRYQSTSKQSLILLQIQSLKYSTFPFFRSLTICSTCIHCTFSMCSLFSLVLNIQQFWDKSSSV